MLLPQERAVAIRRCRVFAEAPLPAEEVILCFPADDERRDSPVMPPRQDVAEAAIRTRVGDVAGDAICVRPTLSLETLRGLLFREHVRAAPVVDDDRRLVGLVSRSDLFRGPPPEGSAAASVVEEIMSPVVHTLPAAAPVAYAISLMALESLHEVPIVDESERVVGVLTATEALRWVARAMGYVEFTRT